MSAQHVTHQAQPAALNIMVALACEAKPLVDFYRLKKLPPAGFDHFQGLAAPDGAYSINLVVSGIGSVNMLQAVAWLAAKTESQSCAWLNVGTAGHLEMPLGTIVQVVHCTDIASEKAFFPPLVANLVAISQSDDRASGASLLSSNSPTSDYPQNSAVDMEAYSFFQSAKRFASSELIQSLKVISDNRDNDLQLLNAARISELIQSQVSLIDKFAQNLVDLVPEKLNSYELSPSLRGLHCTVSQMAQYRDLMNKLDNIQCDMGAIEKAMQGAASMGEVLSFLREIQLTTPPQLTVKDSTK